MAGRMPRAGENGNWMCTKCSNVNFPHRERCNRCDEAKMSATNGMPDMSGNWVCPSMSCKNLNFPHRDKCNRCDTAKPAGAGVPAMGMGMGMGGGARPENAARTLVQGFMHEMNPTQSAINYLLQLSAANPMWFRYGATLENPSMYFGGGGADFGGYGMGGMGGDFGAKRARTGPPVAGVDGNWGCTGCDNVNFASRDKCNRCGADKTATA